MIQVLMSSVLVLVMGAHVATAQKIDERLMGTSRWHEIFPTYHLSHTVPGEPSLSRRHSGRQRSTANRPTVTSSETINT